MLPGSCLISVFLNLFKVLDVCSEVLDLYSGVLPYILDLCFVFLSLGLMF